MTKREYQERQRFEDIIRNESESSGLPWSARVHAAGLLMRHGRTYARIQEMNCNGVEWYQGETNEHFNKRQSRHEAHCEKREQQLECRMREIVTSLGAGFGIVFGGDPRGATVKVVVPSSHTNDWGKEGICVPGA